MRKKLDWKVIALTASILFSVFAIPLVYQWGFGDGQQTEKENTQIAIDEIYNKGFDAGQTDGYESGKKESYQSGWDDGYQNGYSTGKDTGYKLGKSDVDAERYNSGYNAGYAAGVAKNSSASSPSSSSPSTGGTSSGSSDSNSVTVYVTNTGSKYHKAGCSYLRQSKIAISLSEAKAEGYTPCSRCY